MLNHKGFCSSILIIFTHTETLSQQNYPIIFVPGIYKKNRRYKKKKKYKFILYSNFEKLKINDAEKKRI